jgi:SAM-dependent methyltransferase
MGTLRSTAAHVSAYALEDQERMAMAKNYFAWQARLVTRELGRSVVEVGCGIGNFTGTLLDRETVIALDIDRHCTERLMERYPNRKNLHVATCDAGNYAFSELAGFHPDSCVCLNVLEHIEDDRAAVAGMASVLLPGGVIVLLVPAFPSLFGPIDTNLGHHRRYTRRSISRLAAATGLRVKKSHYMNVCGFFGWWANSHIFRRQAQSERQIEFFDRFVVPLLSRLEAAVPPPFGQSLFVVLEKPQTARQS